MVENIFERNNTLLQKIIFYYFRIIFNVKLSINEQMKKQIKLNVLKSAQKNDSASYLKSQLIPEKKDRINKLKINHQAINSPNKENQKSSSNLLSSPVCPLSPLASTFSLEAYHSPTKTTSSQVLQCLKSNKSKQALKQDFKEHSNILYSGFSKDGRYRVQSKALEGEQLRKAVQYQRKVSLNAIISAAKEKEKYKIPQLQPSKISTKENGFVKAYAINTHAGITRNYNQDRVSITLNIKKNDVRSQFFAIYDGHGGNNCCDYLKDNLHQFLINHKQFPANPKKALFQSIVLCESRYCQMVKTKNSKGDFIQRSGSCALIVLLVEDYCYVANVGDSRAILSMDGGKNAFNLSRDHRPIDSREQLRIFQKGGKIYRTQMSKILTKKQEKQQLIIGPLRVFPGKLSVTRTIGDIQAKDNEFGGIKGVISAQPEIKKFKLSSKQDFILLCCDGIFEKMESMQVIEVAWKAMKKQGTTHQLAGKGVDAILREAMRRRSSDNLTAIMVCLSHLKEKQNIINKKIV